MTFNVDHAIIAAYDAVHDREPEPGALVDRLGGEKGFEDAVHGHLVHAVSTIGYGEPGIGQFMQFREHFQKFAVWNDLLELDTHADFGTLFRCYKYFGSWAGLLRKKLDTKAICKYILTRLLTP